MRRQLWLALGICGGLALAAGAWLGTPAGAGVRAWLPGAEEPAPVLVLIVSEREGLEAVRQAVAPERVLVSGPDAFVLREGRVVATDPAAAGPPLTQLGWVDRPIEIWSVRRRREPAEPARERVPGEAPDLAELVHKPFLSLPEALALLDAHY